MRKQSVQALDQRPVLRGVAVLDVGDLFAEKIQLCAPLLGAHPAAQIAPADPRGNSGVEGWSTRHRNP